MFQRIISSYKLLSKSKRFALCILAVLAIAGFYYVDTFPPLAEQLLQQQSIREATHKKLAATKNQVKQLPQTEHEVADLQQKIAEGKKPLPDTVSIEQILAETTVIAQKTGVSINKFAPQEAVLSSTPFQYFQIPVSIQLTGTYNHLAIFFDRLVHLNFLLHVQNISLASINAGGEATSPKENEGKNKVIAVKNQEMLVATAEILAFRAATSEEINAAAISVVPGRAKK